MNNEIIVIKQLPVIVEQLQTIKADVTKRTQQALSLICDENTVQEVKKVRSTLNKEFAEWESKRKDVKKKVMSPYEQFEAVYKDCITDVFNHADAELKNKVDSVERELKAKKAAEVEAYFTEYMQSKGVDFVSFNQAGINVTLSASMKSLKEQAAAFIDRICDDLSLIETQEHKDEILYEYKNTLNVSAAITSVTRRYKAIEEMRQAKLRELEKAEAAKIKPTMETLTPPTVEKAEPIITTQFTVSGTRTQLKALKEFLEKGGYSYK